MKPDVSLPCSREPSTGPDPNQINPVHTAPSYLSKIHFNIILSPTPRSSYWSLSFWLSHQNPTCIPLLPICASCPAHLILDFIILLILDEEYKLVFPHNVVFSNLLSLHPCLVKTSFSVLCSQTPSVYVPPLMSEAKFHTCTKLQANLLLCIF
jgi:hypothetical protein